MFFCYYSHYHYYHQSLSAPVISILLSTNLLSPLLKNLPQTMKISNYRPVSNLSLISKITKRVVKSRLTCHLSPNNLNPHQSAYWKHHSTETALLYIHDNLLDLSAAFDIIDHNILLSRLSFWIGIHDTVLNWFRRKSYLSSRYFRVRCFGSLSSPHDSLYGVPQGSVLRTLLFILYNTPSALSYHPIPWITTSMQMTHSSFSLSAHLISSEV